MVDLHAIDPRLEYSDWEGSSLFLLELELYRVRSSAG